MVNVEQFNDWVVRYNHLFKTRYTKKQKKKFLQSFLTDLTAIQDDVELRGDKEDKDSYHVVVGNLEKARYVLATYYDTPAVYHGDYKIFDTKNQRKKTMYPIAFFASFMLIIGIILTYYVSIPIFNNEFSFKTVLLVLFYVVYFWIFGKVTRGWPEKRNAIRNNSSILFLLQYIAEHPKSNFAFVFYDNGCQGDKSIEKVLGKLNKNRQTLYVLDSIDGTDNLSVVTNHEKQIHQKHFVERVDSSLRGNCKFLFTSTNNSEEINRLFLNKKTLKAKKIDKKNFTRLDTFFRQIEGR